MNKGIQKIVISLSTSVFLLITLVMLVAYASTTFGWFSNNSRVSATGMTIGVAGDSYGVGGNGAASFSGIGEGNYLTLIKDGSDTDIEDIAPGDFGRVSFDITSSTELNSTIAITIQLIGLVGDDDDLSLCEDSDALTLLNGHILFFENRIAIPSTNHYHYTNHITTLHYNTATHNPTTPAQNNDNLYHYTVEFYWIWPRSFGQLVLDEDDSRIRHKTVFDKNVSDRGDMLAYVKANSGLFFVWGNGQSSVFPTSDANYQNTYYVQLTNAYNNADQRIGDNIDYIVVHLTVGA